MFGERMATALAEEPDPFLAKGEVAVDAPSLWRENSRSNDFSYE